MGISGQLDISAFLLEMQKEDLFNIPDGEFDKNIIVMWYNY